MKIVFFGDSLTQGTYGVSYVNKVAAALHGHRFINEGVDGDTSLNLFRRLDKDVLAHQPDGVFIMVGINDALSFAEPGMRWSYRYFKRVRAGQIAPITFRENLRAILMRLRYAQIKVWVALPPVEYRPELIRTLRQMNDYVAEVCREMQVPVLDLMAIMTPAEVPDRPPLKALTGMVWPRVLTTLLRRADEEARRAAGSFTYSFDGVHLTDSGAQQMADEIVPFLRANGVSG